ncbi:DUF4147 domain-containing protein [Laedolimicola ammoniilytica]|uniref:DUF4147 domain-containing protein n=1 Tax=Laedolimicola ammoniilytica TaxID=2981771 RepID=A0ABT2RT20_9FIRM|nr:DUF4147 domain-containing protein [Laedolimicola ammoniilytica]
MMDDNLEMIASGPACGDRSTLEDVCRIKGRYGLVFQEKVETLLRKEMSREVTNVRKVITGSVRELCR